MVNSLSQRNHPLSGADQDIVEEKDCPQFAFPVGWVTELNQERVLYLKLIKSNSQTQ